MKDLNLFKSKDSIHLRKISGKQEALSNLDCDGFLIKGEKSARQIIASLKDKKEKKIIAFLGGDDALNRRAIESLKIDYLVSPEGNTKFDNLKQRDSGLNHVVARMAAEKGVKIIIDMKEVASLKGKEKAVRISRVMQNVRICRKVKCQILIASLVEDKKGLFDVRGRQAFGNGLGMSSSEIRDCTEF